MNPLFLKTAIPLSLIVFLTLLPRMSHSNEYEEYSGIKKEYERGKMDQIFKEFERVKTSPSGSKMPQKGYVNSDKEIQKNRILRAAHQLISTNLVSASRLFAGPDMYPPEGFAAYGIFAFRSLPSTDETHRYKMLCQAYLATLPNASTLKQLPTSQQMVTIWPLEDNEFAHHLNLLKRTNESVCNDAIDNYGFITSLQAIKDAKFSGININGSGPFLLAWSPAKKKGKKGYPVLAADFSEVTTMKEAKRIFLVWREKIEGDSSTWNTGFIATELRDKLRLMVDSLGPRVWQIFKIGAD